MGMTRRLAMAALMAGVLAVIAQFTGSPAASAVTEPAGPSIMTVTATSRGAYYAVKWSRVTGAYAYKVYRNGVYQRTVYQTSTSTTYSVTIQADGVTDTSKSVVPVVSVTSFYKDAYGHTVAGGTTRRSACPRVMLFSARGSGQNSGAALAYGLGDRGLHYWKNLQGQLSVGGAWLDARAVNYPAVALDYADAVNLFTGTYTDSVNRGTNDLIAKIARLNSVCGSATRVAVFGYSQGAEVVGNVWQSSTLIRTQAIVWTLFADPRHNTADKTLPGGVDRPTFAQPKLENGIHLNSIRPALTTSHSDWFNRTYLRHWCSQDDDICSQTGPILPVTVHGDQYDCYEKWAAYDSARWMRSKLYGSSVNIPVAPTCALAP